MERCAVRIGRLLAWSCLSVLGTGCESLGLREGRDARSEAPASYDEFFDDADDVEQASSDGPDRIFRRNRLPGGLSSEARSIERGSFNIY